MKKLNRTMRMILAFVLVVVLLGGGYGLARAMQASHGDKASCHEGKHAMHQMMHHLMHSSAASDEMAEDCLMMKAYAAKHEMMENCPMMKDHPMMQSHDASHQVKDDCPMMQEMNVHESGTGEDHAGGEWIP